MTRSNAFPKIPTLRPRLPRAGAIAPFLREIDANRWYSNFGPLVQRFEARLTEQFAAEAGSVITVSSATTGITLALREAVGDTQGLCMMPAWTFVATPVAAKNAGLTPYFVDVAAETWQLSPEQAIRAIRRAPGPVRAILPVAPFGATVDLDGWADFAETTGIPVLLDAAAAFDTARAHPRIVSIISLHATKVLGIGEGGVVLSGAAARGERLRRMSNFGMDAGRRSIFSGTNVKMSEYAAAVGLAALKEWEPTRHALMSKSEALRGAIGDVDGLDICSHGQFATATFNVMLRAPKADEMIAWMRMFGLEGRKWWGNGCHRHPALSECPRDALPVTEDLAARVVAVPFWVDMSDDEVEMVADCVRRFVPGETVRRARLAALVG